MENCLAPCCWKVSVTSAGQRETGETLRWYKLSSTVGSGFDAFIPCFPLKYTESLLLHPGSMKTGSVSSVSSYTVGIYTSHIWFWVPPNNTNKGGVVLCHLSLSSISVACLKSYTSWKPFNITGINTTTLWERQKIQHIIISQWSLGAKRTQWVKSACLQ